MKDDTNKEFFITVLNHFLQDKEEKISQMVLPTICNLVSKFNEEKRLELLNSLIKP
jgi:hypothetical protein